MSMACNLWVFGLYCYIMEEKLELKSYKIGTGKPLICVPVVGRQKEEILGEAKEIVRQGATILEWRMDWYSQISDWECTQEVLQELAAQGLAEGEDNFLENHTMQILGKIQDEDIRWM